MKSKKELNEQNLDEVAGGAADLDKYLKVLAGKEKDKPLVDIEDEKQLQLDSTVRYNDDGNVTIILRDKPDPEVK